MKKEEIFRPWLAVGVVGLLGPGMPVKTIQSWTDKGYVEVENPNPGKNSPRVYSLANAIQLICMYEATNAGLAVKWASIFGKKCIHRFIHIIEKDPIFDKQLVNSTHEDQICIYWVQDEDVKIVSVSNEFLIDTIRDEGWVLPIGSKFNSGLHAHLMMVDHLLEGIYKNYKEITPEFNQKALEGRLKPFPKSWNEAGFPLDPNHPWNREKK